MLTGSTAGLLFAIPSSLDDAARSLGASIVGTLRRIHLPLMRGGVLTALILVFVETMKEMPATLLLRPFGLDTLAVAAGLVPVLVVIRLSVRRD